MATDFLLIYFMPEKKKKKKANCSNISKLF